MITLNPKYKPLFDDKTRYYVITGGRGSSKSYSVNTAICALTMEEENKALFTRKTMTSAHISIIPEFREKIEKLEWQSYFDITKTEITNTVSGSGILFRGLQSSSGDNTANLKSLQGITTWILDEAEELTDEKVFDRIDLSIRHQTKHNRVILILNPTTKEHWIYKRFFEQAGVNPGFCGVNGNVTYIHTDYRDNINNLSESFLEQIEIIKVNQPEKYKHVILGGWLDKAEGVIFTDWVTGDYQEINSTLHGQDYGFTVDPTTLVSASIDKKNKKIYLREELYKIQLTTTDIYEANKRVAGIRKVYADSAEPRLIEELRKRGNNIEAVEKGPGSVSAGIALMQDYQLVIDPGSINLIKELNNYVWSDKKSGVPVDAYNHLIDACRYACYKELKTSRNVDLKKLGRMLG
ncbi:PBSX family phage terminase large subunit [Chryseobacterium cucumeris]|uniref:PBSX family phage terminase large subunit n=1 Tax=Chryseobacterium cucumeris TaxID=1813611 RepID=UPI00320B8F37